MGANIKKQISQAPNPYLKGQDFKISSQPDILPQYINVLT